MPHRLLLAAVRLAGRPVYALARRRPALNTALWDAQYALGVWRRLDTETNGATPLALVRRYAPGGTILDLGCGTSVNLPLATIPYRQYHGVDISPKAIASARALGRPDTSFEVADIRTYRPTRRYDAILLREVLYYLPPGEVPGLLRRLGAALTPTGKVIVQIWNLAEHEALAGVVRDCGLPLHDEVTQKTARGLVEAIFVLGGPATGHRLGASVSRR